MTDLHNRPQLHDTFSRGSCRHAGRTNAPLTSSYSFPGRRKGPGMTRGLLLHLLRLDVDGSPVSGPQCIYYYAYLVGGGKCVMLKKMVSKTTKTLTCTLTVDIKLIQEETDLFCVGDGLQEVPFLNTYLCPESTWLAEHWFLPQGPAAGQFLPLSSLYHCPNSCSFGGVSHGFSELEAVCLYLQRERVSGGHWVTVRFGNSRK